MNKKLLAVIVAGMLVVTGCSAKEAVQGNQETESSSSEVTPTVEKPEVEAGEDVSDKEEETASHVIEGDQLEKDQALITRFDALIASGDIKGALELYENNVMNVSSETADYLFTVLEQKIRIAQGELLNEIAYDSEIQRALLVAYNPETKKVVLGDYKGPNKSLITKVYDSGLELYNFNGNFQPVADYYRFMDYKSAHSPYIKDYIQLMAVESTQYTVGEGQLLVSYDELMRRMLVAEDFLKEHQRYKEDGLYQLILEQYKGYIQFFMITPIHNGGYDVDSMKITPELKTSYDMLLQNYSTTISAQIIQSFYDYLQNNDFVIDSSIEVVAYDLYETIDSKFN